jgi:hypothetical protein
LGGKKPGFKFTQAIAPHINTRRRFVDEFFQRHWQEQVKATWEKAYPKQFYRNRNLHGYGGVGCSDNPEALECYAIDHQIGTAV